MPANLLTRIALFSDLDDDAIESLGSHAVTRDYPRNSVIINEGEHSDSLYIIVSGRLKAFVSDDDGKEAVLSCMEKDEYFGELALLDDAARSASVMCLEDCTLSVISRQAFEDFLATHLELALPLLRGLARRVRVLTDNVKSLSLLDVYGRVAKLLLEEASEDGERLITSKMTQQDIASRVGSSREMISRILKDLKLGGYIDIEDKRIVINQPLPEKW